MLDLSKWKIAVRRTADFFDRRHWVLLIVAAPFLLFPTPGRSPVLLLIPAIWLAGWLANGEPVPRTPLNAAVLLLSLMVLVSLYATYSIAVSLPKIAGIVLGLGVFYGVTRVGQCPRGWWLSLIIFAGLGAGIAAFSLLGTQWIAKFGFLTPIIQRLPRVFTNLLGAKEGFQPNEVAGALLWITPTLVIMTFWLLMRMKTRWAIRKRVSAIVIGAIAVAATLLVAGTFILTQSRGGFIALAVTGIVLALGVLPRRRSWLAVSMLAVVAIVLGIGYLIFGYGSTPANPADDSTAVSAALSLDTLEGRVEIWSRALEGIKDFPITGMGLNTFRTIVHVFYPLHFAGPNVDVAHAHNEFLQAALDLGLLGLIAFLALYLIAFWMLRKIWRAAPSSLPTRTLALGLAGGLLAHMIYGLTDAVALGAKPGILFWMLLGLITALFLQTQAVKCVRPQM